MGQSFAAKAKGIQAEQILKFLNFTGGMARKGQPQVIGVHPFAIVFYTNQADAALADFNLHKPQRRGL